MDGGGGAPGGGGGGGGPAPFLQKTYDMVNFPDTDDIVSWTSENDRFVVWKPTEFSAQLLPSYFKHSNFSSFIRQLNTYGFRKSDPERWEFTNPDFIKGQRHLLKNIHRRKPVHIHSNPPGGGLADAERNALEEEIDRLSREKVSLQASLSRYRQLQSGTKIQFDDLERRLAGMEQRQLKMFAFMHRAMQNPLFMENLVKMASSTSVGLSHRKRRLPSGLDYCQETCENNLYDNHSSRSKPEMSHVLDREFCDKLKLELGSVIHNGTASSTQNSIEGTDSQEKQTSGGHGTMECLPLVPESLELCDTGASICPTKNLFFPRTPDEGDEPFACQLSLTLASTSMQIDRSECPNGAPNSVDQGTIDLTDLEKDDATTKSDLEMVVSKQGTASSSVVAKATSLQEALPPCNEASAAPPGRVNDTFWEQFLTERPGSLDNEEASSGSRTNPSDERNLETKPDGENIWRNKQDVDELKL